jgi:alkyl hydroperoxide reductase subunit AhpF
MSGVRLESTAGEKALELPIEGAFLEIGLVPNSGPVAALVPLNSRGEIVVGRDQSTALPGFFSAGDVTDRPEKQIVVPRRRELGGSPPTSTRSPRWRRRSVYPAVGDASKMPGNQTR